MIYIKRFLYMWIRVLAIMIGCLAFIWGVIELNRLTITHTQLANFLAFLCVSVIAAAALTYKLWNEIQW